MGNIVDRRHPACTMYPFQLHDQIEGKGWSGWLELKRLEITQGSADRTLPPAGGRIEIADLRERVRKLEAIAEGIEL